jgi:hypothetical protein
MSVPATVRQSGRVRSRPEDFAEQQAGYAAHAERAALVRRMQQEAEQYDDSHPSDEEALPDDESSSSEEEGEEKENTASNPQWTRRTHDIKLPPFTGFTGSCLPRHRVHTELGYVQCFITEELVATITANTIQYASLKGAPPGWTTTTAEMWRFIAVHIFMGIVDLPTMDMYWEEDYKQEYAVRTFSRHRFKELLRYFHIAEPTPPGARHTVIEKIKPLHDLCLQTFPDYYTPPQEFTIDETMVRFKGRSDWKTVIKNKPEPIGYKVYTVGSHGYLLNFQVYKGKGGYATRQGIIHHTVVQLVRRWEESNRILFSDNLYTSPHLCEHLLRVGLRSCGTVRSNRTGLPPNLKAIAKGLGPGETKAWQKGQLGCLAWCDKGPVLMLSTYHRVDHMITFEQDRGPNRPRTATKPQVVLDYNVHKCHVDTVDQLRQYYAMQRKSYKNWPSLAWWLLDICIINAYTLWCLDTHSAVTQRAFRETLMHQLAAAYPIPHPREQVGRPSHRPVVNDGHWPAHSDTRRDCVHCSGGREHRVKTNIVCEVCGVHLCLDCCFKQYHDGQAIDNGEH